MATAYYYQPDRNPNSAALPGVPLRDLTDDEVASYPKYIQRSIEASPMYRKTNPEHDKPRTKAPSKKPAKKKSSPKPAAAPEPTPADDPPALPVEDAPEPEQED